MQNVKADHKCCALCRRWDGNAGLTSGNPRGYVKFNASARGKCALGVRASSAAIDGNTCKDFAISPEAERFKL